jgi:hypothetical protein
MAGMSVHDVLEDATMYSFGACVLSLPLLIFRPVRPFIALSIKWLSYICGLWLWLTAFEFLLSNWGWLPVIIGILFLGVGVGVGVVPVAMVMALIHGDFGNFFFFSHRNRVTHWKPSLRASTGRPSPIRLCGCRLLKTAPSTFPVEFSKLRENIESLT